MKTQNNRPPTHFFVVLPAVACVLLLAGCSLQHRQPAQNIQPVRPEATEASRPRAQRPSMAPAPSAQWVLEKYSDLPIPKGYMLQANESFVFMQGALRSADLTYKGYLEVADLIRFYQEAMPTYGWRFLRLTGVRMKTITFVKGDELCEIIIMVHKPESESGTTHADGALEPVTTHLHIKLNAS